MIIASELCFPSTRPGTCFTDGWAGGLERKILLHRDSNQCPLGYEPKILPVEPPGTHKHTHIHTHVHTHPRKHTHTHPHAHTHAYTHIHTRAHNIYSIINHSVLYRYILTLTKLSGKLEGWSLNVAMVTGSSLENGFTLNIALYERDTWWR